MRIEQIAVEHKAWVSFWRRNILAGTIFFRKAYACKKVDMPPNVIIKQDKVMAVDEDNTVYSIDNGALIEKTSEQDQTLILYPQSNKERGIYTIPETLTIIDGYAFYGQQTLRYIEMNEKVKIIKEYSILFCKLFIKNLDALLLSSKLYFSQCFL